MSAEAADKVAEPASMVANIRMVANDEIEADETAVTLLPPRSGARIEVRKRQQKNVTTWIVGWRWQVKHGGKPVRTASGGYKRGFKYVKTCRDKSRAEALKRAAKSSRRPRPAH